MRRARTRTRTHAYTHAYTHTHSHSLLYENLSCKINEIYYERLYLISQVRTSSAFSFRYTRWMEWKRESTGKFHSECNSWSRFASTFALLKTREIFVEQTKGDGSVMRKCPKLFGRKYISDFTGRDGGDVARSAPSRRSRSKTFIILSLLSYLPNRWETIVKPFRDQRVQSRWKIATSFRQTSAFSTDWTALRKSFGIATRVIPGDRVPGWACLVYRNLNYGWNRSKKNGSLG